MEKLGGYRRYKKYLSRKGTAAFDGHLGDVLCWLLTRGSFIVIKLFDQRLENMSY